ncbi:MAG: hypothetical protein A3F83_17070 [Candidatus Glassbacteria bacterium RIFCSPLOWO2_12_FULL_58_11]|uniref:DUF3311 domain-containing protein n=1 Tax=Candidatus Glassbacteria bacterium RIFCSPLOWO2_12_FULL_58_11 TaxID=1817867 RepID=A0A1F5Z1E1_9BACT|nr:MAG: hypothetical protein A3F83_17070 [Candidatus Glassbacteria bacterium RIFCSPLOWO2_12_FULL_58_11]
MDLPRKKALFRKLLLAFAVSFLLSNGPGLLLVNKPLLIAGMPLLYLWAAGWAAIQIGIILYAYFKLWRDEVEEEFETAGPDRSGEAK